MLTLQINDQDIEQQVHQLYGENDSMLRQAFSQFLQEQRIKQDIEQSLIEIERGEVFELTDIMQQARLKYE
jgi:predicted transcriptional regulator